MASATDVLRQEHDAILRMLDGAEEVARLLERGDQVPADVLSSLMRFFRVFADRCHHGKEEGLLFPLLEKRGLRRERGPIGAMLKEHEQGRWLIREMAAATRAYSAGDAEARPRWSAAARGYAHLLRQHIAKENQILFPMADRPLTDCDQQEITAGFDKLEQEKMGPGMHSELHALMQRLLAEISHR